MTIMLVFFLFIFLWQLTFLCRFLSRIEVGNFLAPFVISFLVLGTSQ